MAFLVGMAGFLLALAAFGAGVWAGQAAKPSRQPRPTVADDQALSEQQRQREFYNFLHYDGGRMTSPTDRQR